MKKKDREEFLKWHDQQQGKEWVFRTEILDYCISDVTILREGVLAFQRAFVETTGLDPLQNAVTIAQACQKVFRFFISHILKF